MNISRPCDTQTTPKPKLREDDNASGTSIMPARLDLPYNDATKHRRLNKATKTDEYPILRILNGDIIG